ncbi:hypothetical protein PRUB_a3320 [Pseudoalteromonas rubra]|uniref:Uncharacterized protein n=2 Tax=Pseudoalteromonas rubra TaxID=43658 RepID=A0A8T0C3C1_9GAMM|nr:hypothetical protein PRUB_a3320 [Pseudoalteromonas rubra]
MHQSGWEIEGNAFGTEYYFERGLRAYFKANKHVKSDLIKVRFSTGLNHKESSKHLIDLAYFIDAVFCHVQYSSCWFFKENSEKFMCPRLFERYFGKDV